MYKYSTRYIVYTKKFPVDVMEGIYIYRSLYPTFSIQWISVPYCTFCLCDDAGYNKQPPQATHCTHMKYITKMPMNCSIFYDSSAQNFAKKLLVTRHIRVGLQVSLIVFIVTEYAVLWAVYFSPLHYAYVRGSSMIYGKVTHKTNMKT